MSDAPAASDGIGPTEEEPGRLTMEQILARAFGPSWRENPDWERVRRWVIDEHEDQFDPPGEDR